LRGDGVSLEAMHWIHIYKRSGYDVSILCGQKEQSSELEKLGVSIKILDNASPDPKSPANQEIFNRLFNKRDETVLDEIISHKPNLSRNSFGITLKMEH
jgi:hypothetical protein